MLMERLHGEFEGLVLRCLEAEERALADGVTDASGNGIVHERAYPRRGAAPVVFPQWLFEGFVGVSVMFNLVVIDIQTRLAANKESGPLWVNLDKVMVIIFLIEVCLRMSALKLQEKICGPAWRRDWFDICILTATLWELVELFMYRGLPKNVSLLRLACICKLVQLFRAIRVFRIFREVRVIMSPTLETISTFFWGLAMLLLMIWVYAAISVQPAAWTTASPHLDDDYHVIEFDAGYLSRFEQSLADGSEWVESVRLLQRMARIFPLAFCSYIMFVQMALLNAAAPLSVENAMQLAVRGHNVMLQDSVSAQSSWLDQMRRAFKEASPDSSMLSWSGFQAHLQDENVMLLLAALDLGVSEVFGLFRLLDQNGCGSVDSEEFLSGCLRLRRRRA